MKKILLLFAVIAVNVVFAVPPKKGKLTVKWSFTGIEVGYDHENKTIVFIDGKEAGVSTVTKQSVPNSIIVDIENGTHEIKIVNYAFYQGVWEEHTIDNNYSIDCVYSTTLKVKKKATIALLFDIDKGTTATVK